MLCRKNEHRDRRCPDVNCNGTFALSSTAFGRLPKILLFQFKRFDSQNNREFKLGHDISLPNQFQPVADGPHYFLTGAVVHYGSTTSSGHFVSIIRCPESGSLYRCNDSQFPVAITSETEAKILNKAYVAMYSEKNETLQSLNQENFSPIMKKMRTNANDSQGTSALNTEKGAHSGIGQMASTVEEADISLPTPPYTSCIPTDNGSSTPNPANMSRAELLQYCETHLPSESTSQNTERLRLAIFSSLFDKCTEQLTIDEMTEVLIKCNGKPNKNKPK